MTLIITSTGDCIILCLSHLLVGAFLPDGVVVSVCGDLVSGRDERADVVPRTDLHDHLAVDPCHVGVAVVLEYRQLTRRRDAVALPHRHQSRDLILEPPLEEMVVELRATEQDPALLASMSKFI